MAEKTSNKRIVALTDFEHVLKRPTMYIGSVVKSEERLTLIRDGKLISDIKEISVGFYKMLVEILDNAFDEAKRMKGKMPRIEIHFNSKDNSVKVVDTGGGFLEASTINVKTGATNVETAMSSLRAGSNFENDDVDDHLIGTNGVGASIVNMLSDRFFVKTVNDHESYTHEWLQFASDDPIVTKKVKGEATGTTVEFTPRKDIFAGCKWDKEYVHSLMIYREFLRKNDPFIGAVKFEVYFDGVLLDLNVNFIPAEHIKVETKLGQLYLWESFQQSASASFINGAICTGIHQRIMSECLVECFNHQRAGNFYETLFILNLPPKLVRFGDQNKTRYAVSRGEIQPEIQKHFFKQVQRTLKLSPLYEKIKKRIEESEKEGDFNALKKEKRAQRNKISDKYFPPSQKTKNLFIVEGGSAMGSICQKRDTYNDAVYALKGKIRNARRLSDLTGNSEIVDLMNILNIDPENSLNCKFERVIISTDADPDGLGHIASLIINLFYKWFPNVIKQGKLYILQTPLLSVDESRKTKYFYSMRDFESYNKVKRPSNVRYLKGLGSLSRADWEHVFADMRLWKVTEDGRSDKMIEMAFSGNAAGRKKWLQS